MKLFVPEIGTVLALTKDWEFSLYTERRNESIALAAGFNYETSRPWNMRTSDPAAASADGWLKAKSYYDWYKRVTLPSGTILTLDRIYIRKGVSGYSSLSFNLDRKSINPYFSAFTKQLNTMKGRARLWAKLDDVNEIEFLH